MVRRNGTPPPAPPLPRAPDVIAAAVRQLEGQLGQKEYVRRIVDAECAQLAQRLLELNQEHAAALQAQAAATDLAGKGEVDAQH